MKFRIVQKGMHFVIQFKQFMFWHTIEDRGLGGIPARFSSPNQAYEVIALLKKNHCSK